MSNKNIATTQANPVYDFHGNPITVIMKGDEPWFIAKEVATILGYRDAHNMVRNLQDDEKDTHLVSSLGGAQKSTIISESGLYASVLKSQKLEAQTFRKWVTSEVLPSIRKTGGYGSIEEMRKQLRWEVEREKAKENFKTMSTELKESRERLGKETLPVHYVSESNMINQVALGVTAKQFREKFDIGKSEPIRDYLTEIALDAIKDMEESNRVLLSINMPYKDRKVALSKLYQERWSVKVGASLLLKGSVYVTEEDVKNISFN